MSIHNGQHERAEIVLGRRIQAGAMLPEQANQFKMPIACSKHQSCLSKSILIIDVHSRVDKRRYLFHIGSMNRLLPFFRHPLKTKTIIGKWPSPRGRV